MHFLINFIEIFLFVFASLVVVKNIYSFIKVMKLKEGKVDSSLFSEIVLGSSISYIITMLIIGF